MTLPAEPIFDDEDNSGGRGGQGGIDRDFNVVKDVMTCQQLLKNILVDKLLCG